MTVGFSLAADELVEDRHFAHPDHIPADRSVLCVLIRDAARRTSEPEPVSEWIPDRSGWHRRVIIPRPWALRDHEELTVVGFFGRRRETVTLETAAAIEDLSAELEAAIPSVPGVLAYTTQLLSDELNYANLVLMDRPETIGRWRETAPHPVAAGPLSAEYYAFVRIYHGLVRTAEIGVEGAVRLHRARYWDFRSTPMWTATRDL